MCDELNKMEAEEEYKLDPDLERLLDAKKMSEKGELLFFLRDRLTKEMITTICISMDLSLTAHDLDGQYEELRSIFKTMEKFEGDRLR